MYQPLLLALVGAFPISDHARHKRKYVSFGILLAKYRERYDISSRAQLVKLLADKAGYIVSVETVTKYENGTRKPTPEFVFVVSLVVGLSSVEQSSLLEAAVADLNQKFFTEYSNAVLRWMSRVSKD